MSNNSTFGITMENVRKRINVSQEIFSKKLVANHEIKPVLTLDIPIYVGFSIPNLSKSLITQISLQMQ